MKKKLMMAATVATISLSGLGAVGLASAATNSSSSSSTGSSLVDKLVAKFGLKKADVQAVFDQEHTEREAQRLTEVQARLKTAVSNGKLTQAQSDAVIAKYKEIQATRQANHATMDTKTDAERKVAIDAERNEFDKWVTDNNIPTEYARLAHGDRHGRHGGPVSRDSDMATPTDTTSTTSN
ncbi:hypothetical protein BH10PAT3_BH10PAT3_1820 [soil metagenome]